MSEQQRFLIARIEKGRTVSGRDVIHLYSDNGRLRYPVLVLFDPSMLADVGIDPNTLSKPIHKRFWAHYQESEKKTSNGNHYRDILYLEPLTPTTPSSGPNNLDLTNEILDDILNELHAIKALLALLVPKIDDTPYHDEPVTSSPDPVTPIDDLADLFDDTEIATDHYKSQDTSTLEPDAARAKFYELASQITSSDPTKFEIVNEMTRTANGSGWVEALQQIQKWIESNQ